MNDLLKRAANFISQQKRNKLRYRLLSVMGVIVVFITTYMLILPGITMERKTICGLEEHTHSEECYTYNTALVCGLEENDEHTHTEECYETSEELICGLEEHTHTEECYENDIDIIADEKTETEAETETEAVTEEEKQTASEVETEEETLPESGFFYYHEERITPEDDTISGGAAEHNEAKKEENIVPDDIVSGSAVGIDTTVETHSEDYVENYTETTTEAVDSLDEQIEMLKAQDIPLCGLPEHKHSELCYNEEGQLICELDEHKHDSSCYSIMLLALNNADSVTAAEGNGWKLTINANATYTLTFNGSEIPENFINSEEISAYANSISMVIVKDSVEKIGNSAFEGCTSLEAVEFEENGKITETGINTFKNCKNLVKVNIEALNNLEYIGTKEGNEGDVFYGSGITSVKIPSKVIKIGERAFSNAEKLVNVDFEENNVMKNLGGATGELFVNCKSLEKVTLENIKSDTFTFGTNPYEDTGFAHCTSLKEITVPKGASGNLSRLFKGCTSLESITFEDNKNEITALTDIVNGTSVEVLDLSPLLLKSLSSSLMSENDNVKVLKLPCSIIGINNIGFVTKCTGLESVEWVNNTTSSVLMLGQYSHFMDNPSLKYFDFENMPDVASLSAQMFMNDISLEKVVISEGIGGIYARAFANCTGIKEVVYKSDKMVSNTNGHITEYGVAADAFSGADKFRLVFTASSKGKFPEYISSKFLAAVQDHVTDMVFDKNISFNIKTDGETLNLNAPFEKGGRYCTDEHDNLYKLESGALKLVYGVRETENITIPRYVTLDGNEYEVTAVGKDAFKGSITKTITFEEPKSVITLDDYAFANAENLESINGENTVEAAASVFALSAEKGSNLFYNTIIGKNVKEDIFNTGAEADNDLPINVNTDTAGSVGLNITLSTDNQITDDEQAGKYYTGNTAKVNATVSNLNDNSVYRIYIRKNKSGEIKIGSIDGYSFELISTDDPDVFYYEFKDIEHGSTLSPAIELVYPNYTEPGNKMQVWGVSLSNDKATEYENKVIKPGENELDGIKTSDTYLEPEWVTKPTEFKVEKEVLNADNISFDELSEGLSSALPDTATSSLKGLSYTVKYSPAEESSVLNVGSDIVKYVDFTDTLTLPETLNWRENINIESTRFVVDESGVTLYACAGEGIENKEYEICRITGFGKVTSMWLSKTEDGKYTIGWRSTNQSLTSEIPYIEGTLTLGDEILLAKPMGEKADVGTIHNDITADTHYSFSEPKTSEDSADVTLGEGEGKLLFDKEMIEKPEYMGEDVEYVITVKNPMLFPYKGIDRLEDAVSISENNLQYIKPENIQALFDGTDGEYLTVTITNAVITAIVDSTAVSIDGKNKAELTATDTGKTTPYNGCADADENIISKEAVITLTKLTNGNININVSYNSENKDITVGTDGDYEDIKSALDSIAYIVTANDNYKLVWDYPDDYSLDGGKTKKYNIRATVKNSLMYLPSKDALYYYGWPKDVDVWADNKASLYTTAPDSDPYTDNTEPFKVYYDLGISKGGYVNGVTINGNGDEGVEVHKVEYGDVIDYAVDLRHRGRSVYDTLPLVDKMSGLQALLVPVKDNRQLEGKGLPTLTDKGIEYYVLNQEGEYKGLYINGLYADSVTVTSVASGLETLIKYYITDLPQRDTSYTFAYKAICDTKYVTPTVESNGFSVNNEAWANDYPTHRIYAPLLTGGAAVLFDKKIVTERGGEPAFDELDSDDFTPITRSDNEVVYRLELTNPYENETTVKGNDIYDALPNTGEVFKWTKDTNISILDYAATNGAELQLGDITKGNEWSITDTSPNPDLPSSAGQQYIVWDNAVNIKLPPHSGIYIYVKLTFPEDADWDNYVAKKGNDRLTNTFYVYNLPETVSHMLAEPGKVILQKGVYETGYYATDGTYLLEYYRDKDRYHYSINDKEVKLDGGKVDMNGVLNTVTYYFFIKNSGTTNMTLAPVYDILPEGFQFFALRNSAAKNFSTDANWASNRYFVGARNYDRTNKFAPTAPRDNGQQLQNIIAVPEGLDKWKNRAETQAAGTFVMAYIVYDGTVQTEDGRNRLKFHFEKGDKITDDGDPVEYNLGVDENENPYLRPGEFTQFAYTVITPSKDYGKDAVNYVAMEYVDNGNNGVEADRDTKVNVSDANGMLPNDGGCDVLSDEHAGKLGFTEHTDLNADTVNKQWLVSDVKLTRGEIIPGITKTVESPFAEQGGKVKWKITAHNNGTDALYDYVIEDTLEPGFKFQGDLRFSIFARTAKVDGIPNDHTNIRLQSGNADGLGEDILFRIKERENGDTSLKIITNNNGKDTEPIEIKADDTEKDIAAWYILPNTDKNTSKYCRIKIKFEQNKNSKGETVEKLTLHFVSINEWSGETGYNVYSIPPGGYCELDIPTVAANDIPTGTYINTADIIPTQDFNTRLVSQGKPFTDSGKGVKSSAPVSVYIGQPTTSYKEIVEVGNDTNNGISNALDHNCIFLSDSTKTFRYTLNISNAGENAMDKLVVIDNLPFVGDGNTVRQDLARDSEFKVKLAAEPNIEVKVVAPDNTETPLTNTQYTIGYSTKNGSSDGGNSYIDEDWKGTSEWNDLAEKARSLRVVIDNSEVGDKLIQGNSTVKISFNAVIDGEAEPSQVAWNSFGYRYWSGDLFATAAPLNVGVRIPSAPQIKKTIVNSKGSLSKADKEKTYRFVIYKSESGNKIDFPDYTENGISSKLGEQWNEAKHWTVITLKVPSGASQSEIFSLADGSVNEWNNNNYASGSFQENTEKKWKWEEGATYYAVEVDDEGNYAFDSINGMPDRQYSFVYNKDKNEEITFANAKPDWRIDILKVDKEDNSRLAGALFGLYSPNEADQMTSEEMEALGIDEKNFATVEYEEKNYYLSDTKETPDSGIARFTGVCEEKYVVLEIKAPNGYYGDTKPHYIERDAEVSDYIATLTVENEKGVPLPVTGGYGLTDTLKLLALLLISFSAVTFIFRYVRRNI